jgi:hypothetical protein
VVFQKSFEKWIDKFSQDIDHSSFSPIQSTVHKVITPVSPNVAQSTWHYRKSIEYGIEYTGILKKNSKDQCNDEGNDKETQPKIIQYHTTNFKISEVIIRQNNLLREPVR